MKSTKVSRNFKQKRPVTSGRSTRFLVHLSLYDVPHDLACTSSNHHKPCIPEVTLHRQFLGIAYASMDLQRLVRHLEGRFRRVQLSDCAFPSCRLSSVENSGSMKNEETGSLKLDSHVSYLEAHPLKMTNWTAKLFSLRRVVHSSLKGGASDPHHSSSHSGTFPVQLIQDDWETMVQTAHQILSWDTDPAQP